MDFTVADHSGQQQWFAEQRSDEIRRQRWPRCVDGSRQTIGIEFGHHANARAQHSIVRRRGTIADFFVTIPFKTHSFMGEFQFFTGELVHGCHLSRSVTAIE